MATDDKAQGEGLGTNNSNASDSDVEVASVNEKSLLRKLDIRLLPAVSILYLLSFLDRSNGTLHVCCNSMIMRLMGV